jgi:DNA-binding SARP family transcriptional activator
MADSTTRLPTPSIPTNALDHVVVRLRLIGQMEAWTVRSESVLPAGRKTRALLASIAMAAPRPVLRGRLAEQLWSRRPEEQARASLRQEIHRLLDALSPAETEVLIITRDHLTLRPGAVWIDVEEVTGTCWRIWTGSIRTSTPG